MRRFFRPRKKEPRVHTVIITLESPTKLVRLKSASDAHQQVVQDNRRPALPTRSRSSCHSRLRARTRCPARWSIVSYSKTGARVHQRRTPGPAVLLPIERQVAQLCCPTGTVSAPRMGLARLHWLASALLAI